MDWVNSSLWYSIVSISFLSFALNHLQHAFYEMWKDQTSLYFYRRQHTHTRTRTHIQNVNTHPLHLKALSFLFYVEYNILNRFHCFISFISHLTFAAFDSGLCQLYFECEWMEWNGMLRRCEQWTLRHFNRHFKFYKQICIYIILNCHNTDTHECAYKITLNDNRLCLCWIVSSVFCYCESQLTDITDTSL